MNTYSYFGPKMPQVEKHRNIKKWRKIPNFEGTTAVFSSKTDKTANNYPIMDKKYYFVVFIPNPMPSPMGRIIVLNDGWLKNILLNSRTSRVEER